MFCTFTLALSVVCVQCPLLLLLLLLLLNYWNEVSLNSLTPRSTLSDCVIMIEYEALVE